MLIEVVVKNNNEKLNLHEVSESFPRNCLSNYSFHKLGNGLTDSVLKK